VDNRLRVLQIIYSFDIEGSGGGVARFAIALSHALDKNLFDVSICGLWDTGKETERQHLNELNTLGVKAFTAATWDEKKPYLSLWKSYQGLRTSIEKSKVDIVHSHSEFSDIVSLMLKLYPGVPIIMRTLHNGYPIEWRKRYIRRVLLSYILYPLLFNSEIGVARHVVKNMDRRWLAKLLNHKAILIHNAINIGKFSRIDHISDKSKLGLAIPSDAVVIGSIGRLRIEKGYDTMLEAAAEVIQQTEGSIKFIIIGTGELEETLIKQAQKLNISDHVIFTGPRTDIEFLLSGMDLFVSSSYWEGFSTSVLEAMAAGVPVLATDIPGNRELVEPGINGWLVAAHNPDALAQEIISHINTPIKIKQGIIEQGQKVAFTYSIQSVAKQYQSLYESIYKKK
jgi:glycosyltransferase involved in cell wall biosynthesis